MKQFKGGGGGCRSVLQSGHISTTVIPLPFYLNNLNTRSLDGHWPVTGQVPTAVLYKTSRVTIEGHHFPLSCGRMNLLLQLAILLLSLTAASPVPAPLRRYSNGALVPEEERAVASVRELHLAALRAATEEAAAAQEYDDFQRAEETEYDDDLRGDDELEKQGGRPIIRPVPRPIPRPIPLPIPRPIPRPIPFPLPLPLPRPIPLPFPLPIPRPIPRPIPLPIPRPLPPRNREDAYDYFDEY